MRDPMKFVSRNTKKIALIALLLAFTKASVALSHLALGVIGLTQTFSTESQMVLRSIHLNWGLGSQKDNEIQKVYPLCYQLKAPVQ